MKLYVMRHGPAEDDSPTGRDADRALTPPGRERTRSVARELARKEEAPLTIMTSPLVRALQTAEIVAAGCDLEKRVREAKNTGGAPGAIEIRRELAPGGDALGLLAELLRAGRKRVMVVGHEPDLSMLVAALVGRPPEQGMLKSMVVGLQLEPLRGVTEGGASAEGAATAEGEGAVTAEAQRRGYTAASRFILDPKTLDWQRD